MLFGGLNGLLGSKVLRVEPPSISFCLELHGREALELLGLGRLALDRDGRGRRLLGRLLEHQRNRDQPGQQQHGHGPEALGAQVGPDIVQESSS